MSVVSTFNTTIIMKYTDTNSETTISKLITSESFKTNNSNYYVTKINSKTKDNKSASKLAKAEINEVPLNYTEITNPLLTVPLYAFVDQDGNTQYRLYVERKNNNAIEYGFIRAKQSIVNLNIKIDYDINSEFVDISKEQYGTIVPEEAPDDKIHDLISVFGYNGLYYGVNNNTKEYYIYGHYKNSKSAFYLADKNGNMIPGTLPVNIY